MHQGSWLGLPDFGITEAIGNLFGAPTTQQGGSNLSALVTGQAASPVQSSYPPTSNSGSYYPNSANGYRSLNNGQVLGTSTLAKTSTAPTSQVSGPSMSDQINSIYAPVNDYLNQAYSAVTSAFPQIQSGIESQYQTSANSLSQQNKEGTQQLDTQASQADKRKTDAMNAAIQLYNELQRGGQQRFGGATSAGQGYSELIARQLQQQQGQTQGQYGDAMTQINTARQNLNDKYNLSLQNLQDQKNTALNQAQQEYNDRLLQISRMRSENESSKASAQMEALQNLRNQVFSINLQALQSSQQLGSQFNQNSSILNSYLQNASQALSGGDQAVNNFINASTVNPANAYTLGYAPQQQSTAAPTGVAYTSGGRKYDVYGNPIG